MELIFNNREIKPNVCDNWGDSIALDLIKGLCSNNFSTAINDDHIFNLCGHNKNGKLISVGSVMNYTMSNDFVWGTGCIKQGSIGEKPKEITAVRGALTRHELILAGYDCPQVYGDPVLLLPLIYPLRTDFKYKWGIIPHYIEFVNEFGLSTLKNLEKLGFKIIDICTPGTEFLQQIAECENILSSSLHGLIVSDAYGIPNGRVSITNKLIGSHFKFVDYFTSVDRSIDWSVQLSPTTTMNHIDKIILNDKIRFDSDNLLSSAPWHLKTFNQIFQ